MSIPPTFNFSVGELPYLEGPLIGVGHMSKYTAVSTVFLIREATCLSTAEIVRDYSFSLEL